MIRTSPLHCPSLCWFAAPLLACSLALAACGSSNNASTPLDDDPVPGSAAEPILTLHSVKTFRFSWSDVSDATHYKLLENPNGISGFSQVENDVLQGTEHVDHIVPLYARTNAQYVVQSCNSNGCVDSNTLTVSSTMDTGIGYLKASNTDWQDCIGSCGDNFGGAVSLSADGSTLAIGAYSEDSNAIGVNGNQNDQSARESGAVYVFIRTKGQWSQQAYFKASNTNNEENSTRLRPRDSFGSSVALSTDGNTLVVGASGEDSIATGINGNQNDNSASRSGAAYVFTRSGNEWSQQAYLKASNTEVDVYQGDDEWGDFFGKSVGLSADGSTLVVGAPGEDSNATGINGNQSDNLSQLSGAVYVFTRTAAGWSQQAYLKASNTNMISWFGASVSVSADGNTLAVGTPMEWSNATGVIDINDDEAARESGAVYMFARNGGEWSQEAFLKASNAEQRDQFGRSVSLNADGNVLAVGAPKEDSNAMGINGDVADNSSNDSGAVYLFTHSGTDWRQQAYIKSSNNDEVCNQIDNCYGDNFGNSVSLSADGKVLAVGAESEDSAATGLGGNQSNNSAQDAGAVYVFTHSNGEWNQQAYLKASNTDEGDRFGNAVSLSADADTLAVGAVSERSNATGVDGNQEDNSVHRAGAVYVY